jgi:hypothetical protein
LLAIGFPGFAVSAFATAGAGTLLAAGGDANPSCEDGAADAVESSLYSHAVPIAGIMPKIANAVATNTRFMIASCDLIVPTLQFALNENACQQGMRIAPGTVTEHRRVSIVHRYLRCIFPVYSIFQKL